MTDYNALAKECHEAAVTMGFYDGVKPDDKLACSEHLWKQLCHLFIEIEEAKIDFVNGLAAWVEEMADVAIVLLDLTGWMEIPLAEIDFIESDRGNVFSVINNDAYLLANHIRKRGIDKAHFAGTANHLLSALNWFLGGGLKGHVYIKVQRNLTRGKRYGLPVTGE